ncbi:MAG: tetratricopeptide repeat protein [Pseudomonadota bacterium]
MQARLLLRFITLFLAISFSASIFAAEDASMHQVYLAAEAGKFSEAQAMMDKVLHDHPNSAKAHFVEAELMAKQGNVSGAQDELNMAERLQPGLPFAKPQAVQKLKAQLVPTRAATQSISNQSYPAANNNGTPWGMIFLMIGLIAFIYFVAKLFTRRNPPVMTGSNYSGNVNPQPYGGGVPAPAMGQSTGSGIGSGIMGGLATGAAVGAGMVAGEALMHHFTDGNRNNGSLFNEAQANTNSMNTNDMGGSDFGIADNSSWDDNSSGDDWS